MLFGALFRVIYFMGISTLLVFTVASVWASIAGGTTPSLSDLPNVWQGIGERIRSDLGDNFLLSVFLGLWSGAASHTLTDIAGSFIKTGRRSKFL